MLHLWPRLLLRVSTCTCRLRPLLPMPPTLTAVVSDMHATCRRKQLQQV